MNLKSFTVCLFSTLLFNGISWAQSSVAQSTNTDTQFIIEGLDDSPSTETTEPAEQEIQYVENPVVQEPPPTTEPTINSGRRNLPAIYQPAQQQQRPTNRSLSTDLDPQQNCRRPAGENSASYDGGLKCLKCICFLEAGNQSRSGQLYVLQNVLGRVADSRYPGDICAVTFQQRPSNQYQPNHPSPRYRKTHLSVPRNHRCNQLAENAIQGDFGSLTGSNAYAFFRTVASHRASLSQRWYRNACSRGQKTVGNHVFCDPVPRRYLSAVYGGRLQPDSGNTNSRQGGNQ